MALADEVKQLELKVDGLSRDFKAVAADIESMGKSVAKIELIEERQKNEKEFTARLSSKFDELSEVIRNLNDAVNMMNGRAQGVTMTMKIVWGLVGTIVTAAIISVSTTVIELKTEVAVLQSKVPK